MSRSLNQRCASCPLFLRTTDSCPRNPQDLFLYAFPSDLEQLSKFDFFSVEGWDLLQDNLYVFVSIICQFLFIAHFLLFIKYRSRNLLRIVMITFIQKVIAEIMKKIVEEKRPIEACRFSDSVMYGNPSELSAVATSFVIGHLYSYAYQGKLFEIGNLLKISVFTLYAYLVFVSRIFLYYNTAD